MKKLAYLVALTPFFASAGLFTLTCDNGTGILACNNQGQNVLNAIAEEVNKNLPSAGSQSEYFKGMSTANSMSAAGVTTSYATSFDKFLVGLTASGGVHLGSKSMSDISDFSDNPEQFRGFGMQAAVIFGFNLGNVFKMDKEGWIDPTKLNLYASGFALNKKFGDVDTDYMGFGVGGQYQLMDEVSWAGKSVKWTGVEVGAGILYSKLDVDGVVSLNRTYSTTAAGTTYTGTMTSNALLNAKVSTLTMPLEISTGMRFLYFLKLVGGMGVDINLGKSEGSGRLSDNSTVTVNGGGESVDGDPNLSLNGSEAGDLLNLRVFAGPHIEFGVGSIFVTVHRSLLENALAVNSGVNFFW